MAVFGAPEFVTFVVLLVIAIVVVVVIALGPPSAPKHQNPPPPTAAPGWRADPTQRHQYRFWDGTQWTAAVSDDDQPSTDPM